MIDRKKKLRIIQISLLLLGTINYNFFTYIKMIMRFENEIFSSKTRKNKKNLSS